MNNKIQVEKSGHVTIITINRPEVRNALDRESMTALAEQIRLFEEDDNARVAVLTGAGGNFCSGADLKELATGVKYDAWAGQDGPLARPAQKPVIAAIEGFVCAGGLGVALWCDLRLASDSASFAVLSRRWGVPMSDGTTVRLARTVGQGFALDMLLSARIVTAQEALQAGLVTRLAPSGQALTKALELASQMAEFPQVAMLSDRRSMYDQEGLSMADALIQETAYAEEAKNLEAVPGAKRFAAGEGRHGEVG